MKPKIIKKEWAFVIILSVVVLTMTIIPYVYGFFVAKPGMVFMGNHTVNAGDTYSYIAWMEQAREGKLLFSEQYAIEEQKPVFFQPLFYLMGNFARISGFSNIFVFHLFRVILGFIFLLLMYYFVAHFFDDAVLRKVCFLILLFSSGVGWIFGHFLNSYDLWASELITFLSLYESPLNLLALILLVGAFIAMLRYFVDFRKKHVIFIGLMLLLLFFIHPYDVITVVVFYIAYLLILFIFFRDTKALKQGLIGFLIMSLMALPGIVYLYFVYSNFVFFSWIIANITLSNSPLNYIFGFGIVFILAVIGGLVGLLKELNKKIIFLLCWIIVTAVLLYQPTFLFQRKLGLGLHIPITILATIGFFFLMDFLKIKRQSLLFFLVLILLLVITFGSNAMLLANDVVTFQQNQSPYYLSGDYFSVFNWIRKNTQKNSILLASFWPSNYAPGLTGKRVYYGHGDQTPDAWLKYHRKQRFFLNDNKEEKLKFLENNNIDYIIFGELEKSEGYKDLSQYDFLKPVFQSGDAIIYQVL